MQPGLDASPLVGGEDPGDDVEGPGPVDALAVGVDGERDALVQDVDVGGVLADLQLGRPERASIPASAAAAGRGVAVGGEELVPGSGPPAEVSLVTPLPTGGPVRLDLASVTSS